MIKVIAVGKLKEKSTQSLVSEYQKRLQTHHKLEIVELAKSKHKDHEIDKIVADESERILSKINSNDFVVLLDLKGKDIDSEMLSEKIEAVLDQGQTMVFVIGGSHGVNDKMRVRANFMWRISLLTFPHQLVRILLLEQIYRGFAILKGHPYHK